MFENFFLWLSQLFKNKQRPKVRKVLPPILYTEITVLQKAPKNEDVKNKDFFLVSPSGVPKWILFKCPCGCSHVVTLSVQPVHNPRWRLGLNAEGAPTLHPSVWQKTGCHSHFWVRDGRIFWCENTGTPSTFG